MFKARDLFHKCKYILNATFITLGILSVALPATAAERVVLIYKVFRESVSVEELRTLADTGKPSRSLARYCEIANLTPEKLQESLNKPVNVDAVTLSDILNSFPGELVLDGASEIIRTPSQSASRQSLRGAMVTSAVPDNNVRTIEILENYPTDEVYVEGDRLAEIYSTVNDVVSTISRLNIKF
jgi:hypothetical protein